MRKYELWAKTNYGGGTDTQTNKQTHTQTHQYHDSAWPRGRAECKLTKYPSFYITHSICFTKKA